MDRNTATKKFIAGVVEQGQKNMAARRSCSAQSSGWVSSIDIEIIKEAADFIERLPGEVIEAHGGRFPMADELHGIALLLGKPNN